MKLLVVVDYQKDFVDGALGFPGAENLDEKIVNKIQEYMQDGCEIFYTMESGQIKIRWDEEGVKVYEFKKKEFYRVRN